MRYSKAFLAAVIFLVLVVSGCSNDEEDNQINFGLVATENILPLHFDEIAFKREEPPYYKYLVNKVVNETEFEEMWNIYGFVIKMPEVNFTEKDIFFIGLHESSSCPYDIKTLTRDLNNESIKVSLSHPWQDCTSDATPRTFVIELEKEISSSLKNVEIVEGDTNTSITIDES